MLKDTNSRKRTLPRTKKPIFCQSARIALSSFRTKKLSFHQSKVRCENKPKNKFLMRLRNGLIIRSGHNSIEESTALAERYDENTKSFSQTPEVNTKAWTATSTFGFRTSSSSSPSSSSEFGVLDKQKDMLNFIEEPMESTVGDGPSNVPPESDDLSDLVRCIARAADGRKADDIVAIRVSDVSTVTSFVVIVSGNSRPQNQAIAAAVKSDVDEQFSLLPGATGVPEGTADSGWTVLDYGSVMVHVMTPKSRLYYNVEGQWSRGEYMDLSDVLIPNAPPVSIEKEELDVPEEEDPFWS